LPDDARQHEWNEERDADGHDHEDVDDEGDEPLGRSREPELEGDVLGAHESERRVERRECGGGHALAGADSPGRGLGGL
jgi:hypothetical protein